MISGMNAEEFIAQLEAALAHVRAERTVLAKFEPGFVSGPTNGTVFVTFINLPFARFKERRGGGAEAENNRVLFSVDGFSSDPGVPVAKVTVETRVNNVVSRDRRLRKKTAAPAKIAEHMAKYIGEVASSTSPNFTHE